MSRNKVHPPCYQHQQKKKCKRITCKYFEIGLMGTGSRSVCHVVRTFGFYAKHGFNNCKLCQNDFMRKFYYANISTYLYGSCEYSGNVASLHWIDLAEQLPEAKFILTYRPVDIWWDSVLNKDKRGFSMKWASIARKLPLNFAGLYNLIHFGSCALQENKWKYRYEKYNDEVRSYFSCEEKRFAFIDMSSSDDSKWSCLAELFGVTDIPEETFPRIRTILKRIYEPT